MLGCGRGVFSPRPLSSRPLTQTRPINSTQNRFQSAEVGTTVKYQVWSVHTRPVYTTGTTGTGQIVMFGTATIPVPETLVSLAWHQYRYRTLHYVWYDTKTGTGHFGKLGTISISHHTFRSVRYRYGCRAEPSEASGTGIDAMPNSPKLLEPVLLPCRTYRCVRYR